MTKCSVEYVETRRDLIARLPQGGRVAELGVFRGDFAQELLDVMQPHSLHLIDRWLGTIECGDKDGENLQWRAGEACFVEVIQRFEADRRVFIHRGCTVSRLDDFADDYFDFIYVDADHSEAGVEADLSMARRKCRGPIGGHDYCLRFGGVMKAVDAFCRRWHYRLTLLTRDGCPSYLLERP